MKKINPVRKTANYVKKKIVGQESQTKGLSNGIKILAIETSCDETGTAILEGRGNFKNPRFKILANIVSSQIKIHAPWGGVVPSLAKREHQTNLIPVLKKALKRSKLLIFNPPPVKISKQTEDDINKILKREPELSKKFLKEILKIKKPKINAVAVTRGPGLEPALWVGINFAKALALIWKKPLIAVNHLEGHILSVFLNKQKFLISFPALALLISGGHTELVLIKRFLKYKIIGRTRDDAAGEAFDKTAKLLGLGYPGGPAVSALAKTTISKSKIKLPRPMIDSRDFDFSFSGLKTAVLYLVKKLPELTPGIKAQICREFQQAVVDVLIAKTLKAAQKYKPKTIILGGGVAANQELRKQIKKELSKKFPKTPLCLPEIRFTGDNAAMIAAAGCLKAFKKKFVKNINTLKADGNLKLN